MKYIKPYKINENSLTTKYNFTHEIIRKIAQNIVEKTNLSNKSFNIDDDEKIGFKAWYTNNWCFEKNKNKPFFCKYYFHFYDKSKIPNLTNFLKENNIQYQKSVETLNDKIYVIYFDYTNQIIEEVIKKENPSFTKKDIEQEIKMLNTLNKYNL